MNILIDNLCLGDGTYSRPDSSIIYYSSNKQLADDVQELAFMCGYETSLYGPYTEYDPRLNAYSTKFQVHINKTRTQFKRCIRNKNIRKIKVEEPTRVVCFTVPNGTLITRRNGHIGIHGNSKHAMHLVRLTRMAKEILLEGTVKVKRPDAEELNAIRDGAWTYDELIEWADKKNKELDEIYRKKEYIVPKKPNSKKIHELYDTLVMEYGS
jgi:hypothetical protein